MKKLGLLIISLMLVLCMTACSPKPKDSLDAEIEQAQADLEFFEENLERVERENEEVEKSLEKIEQLEKALSNAAP